MIPSPVFITGLPRSGTTLLGNIIDRHPRLAIFVESFFIPQYYYLQVLYWPLTRPEKFLGLAKAIVNEDASKRNQLKMNPDHLAATEPRNFGRLLDTLMSDWAAAQGKVRWGDKSPGYVTKLPMFEKLYPEAKFIHIMRDGRDVWLSLKKLGWETNVVKVARTWEKVLRRARRYGQSVNPSHYYELRYEDLISRPEEELKKIMAFLGEPYTDALLHTGNAKGKNIAFKGWPKIHEGIEAGNRNKWEKEMSAEEVALFESQAAPMLRELGYPLSDRKPSGSIFWKRWRLTAGSHIETVSSAVRRRSAILIRHWNNAKS
jgi:Sulfotransferase family